jgi:hypothetical protein
MSASQPVPLLPEMALSTELVAVIKIYLLSLSIRQKITIFLIMTLYASQPVVP